MLYPVLKRAHRIRNIPYLVSGAHGLFKSCRHACSRSGATGIEHRLGYVFLDDVGR